MNNEKIKITFEFELSFHEDVKESDKKVEIDAIKDYINNHLQELHGHRNFGTKINTINLKK